MKKCLLVLGIALIVLSSCPSPDGNGPGVGGGIISGKVTDWITGDPISGASVIFGSYSDTTNASGEYSITVDSSVSSVQGVFAVFKGLDYYFLVSGGISIDPTTNLTYDIQLNPLDTLLYSDVTLSGRIYDSGGVNEIADGCKVDLEILNEKGGAGGGEYDAIYNSSGGGYSQTTQTYGSDCFVVVDVEDPADNPLFRLHLTNQDLSSGRTNYDHTQPSISSYTTVTFNGTRGTMFLGDLVVPGYGGIESYEEGDIFIGSSQTTRDIYNPNDYPFNWWTITLLENTPGTGDETMKINAKEIAFSSTINLPSEVTEIGPTEIVDGNTVSWDGSTLSFTGASGANGYVVDIYDDADNFGIIFMTSASITFPDELITSVLDPGAGWDIEVSPLWSPDDLFEISLHTSGGGPPLGIDLKAVIVSPADVTKVDIIP